MTKITVITVCLNAADCLDRTIKSVVGQQYPSLEYIVIDGGSIDGSIEIINKYKKEITTFVSEKDSGIYNAMNKGVALATGDYSIFMNAGDWFVNEKVLQNVSVHLQGEDIVSGNEVAVKNGRIEDYLRAQRDVTFNFLCTDCICHQATFIKTSLLRNHPYDENLKIASDWKFWLEQLVINKRSYKCIDVDICLFSRDGISTKDMGLVSSVERQKTISELMGKSAEAQFLSENKRGIIQYVFYRIRRYLARKKRLILYHKHLNTVTCREFVGNI